MSDESDRKLTAEEALGRFHIYLAHIFTKLGEGVRDLNARNINTDGITTSHVQLASLAVSAMGKVNVLDIFVNNSYKHWNKIMNREMNFFIENADSIFGGIPALKDSNGNSRITIFKTVFSSGHLNSDIVEEIWATLAVMVKGAVKYLHRGGSFDSKRAGTVHVVSNTQRYITEYKIDMMK